jgi:uncharacterized protein (TIGR03000 family)
MRRNRLAAAVLLAAGALLLAPATGSAQVSKGESDTGGAMSGYSPTAPGGLSWPGAFSYTQRNYWYGYNWPYKGYYNHHYNGPPPYFPSGASATSKGDQNSYYSYGSLSGQEGGTARVKVTLPDADAQVWFEGQLTRQRGKERGFVSPQLDAGQEYVYDVRARWTENGREVERTRTVRVRADGVATVDFTASADSR